MTRRQLRLRLASLVALGALLASAGTASAGAWRFYGGAGLYAGRTDNPNLSDPNAPASARRGAATGTVRLTGGVLAIWPRTEFDAAWSPQGYYYDGRNDLNTVSHSLNSTWKHNWSAASSLELTETAHYTPENEIDPNALGNATVIVERTNRTYSNFRGNYQLDVGPASSVFWRYNWLERLYSSSSYIDTSHHTIAMEWRRRLGQGGHSIFSGYNYGIFSFKGNAPGSDRHAANLGYAYETARGFVMSLAGGYNILIPDDPALEQSSGANVNANIGYNGTRLTMTAGYLQGITDGGGVYANAESRNAHATIKMTFSQHLEGDISYATILHDRINTSSTQPVSEETVHTQSGRAQLSWRLGQQWAAQASFTRHHQTVDSNAPTATVAELTTNRYAIGISWSTR